MPPILLLGVAWLIGLALALLHEPAIVLLWLGGAAVVVVLSRDRLPLPWPLAVLTLGVAALGLGRGLPPPATPPPPIPPGVSAVRGVVATWPRTAEALALTRLEAREIQIGGAWQPWSGTLDTWLPLHPAVQTGDLIEAVGQPRGLADLTNARQAARGRQEGLTGHLTARSVTLLARTPPVGLLAWRDPLVQTIGAMLNRALPIPVAGLAAGVLIGQRGALPPDVYADFVTTGTVHLLVVSGWNMTLIIAIIAWLGGRAGVAHHPLWLPIALPLIVLYTLLVGAEPSVLRAALMGGVTVAALALGRRANPLVALVLAAGVMAGWHPPLLIDLGFQLSFLATLGLLTAMPLLAPRLAGWPWPVLLVVEPLAATMAAQLAVEPLLAATFGRVSLIAPVVNLLVVPLAPLVMGGAFLIVMLSAPGWPGLPLLALPVELVAGATAAIGHLLLTIVTSGANLPLASLSVPMPPAVAGAVYVLLGVAAGLALMPTPGVTVRRLASGARAAAPALTLLGLATAAGVIWLVLLGGA